MKQVDARIVRQLFWLGTKTAAGQAMASVTSCYGGCNLLRMCVVMGARRKFDHIVLVLHELHWQWLPVTAFKCSCI